MSHEVISYLLKSKDMRQRLQFQLVLQCAPFLKGLKASCVINIDRALSDQLQSVLNGTGVSYAVLTQDKERCLVFFYREKGLQEFLDGEEVRKFLQGYGYISFGVREVITKLREHVSVYCCRDGEFPHEMGIILGYPITDVKGFIEHKGQNYLFSGYWKVYDNLMQARMTFGMYDYAKKCAVNEFVAGEPIEQIVCVG